MVNASKFMRQIEGQMHGTMTASERLEKITKVVNDYKIEVEKETNLPYYQAMDQEIANERLSEWEFDQMKNHDHIPAYLESARCQR
jgi:hypothetical protein